MSECIYIRVSVCVHRKVRFYDGSTADVTTTVRLAFLSIHKMVTRRKFNNLYFHIRGFAPPPPQQRQRRRR